MCTEYFISNFVENVLSVIQNRKTRIRLTTQVIFHHKDNNVSIFKAFLSSKVLWYIHKFFLMHELTYRPNFNLLSFTSCYLLSSIYLSICLISFYLSIYLSNYLFVDISRFFLFIDLIWSLSMTSPTVRLTTKVRQQSTFMVDCSGE